MNTMNSLPFSTAEQVREFNNAQPHNSCRGFFCRKPLFPVLYLESTALVTYFTWRQKTSGGVKFMNLCEECSNKRSAELLEKGWGQLSKTYEGMPFGKKEQLIDEAPVISYDGWQL